LEKFGGVTTDVTGFTKDSSSIPPRRRDHVFYLVPDHLRRWNHFRAAVREPSRGARWALDKRLNFRAGVIETLVFASATILQCAARELTAVESGNRRAPFPT
jgi:hypothetical protein